LIHIAICQTDRLFILLERAEKEKRFSKANGMFKTKMDRKKKQGSKDIMLQHQDATS
jgi:hypothetical protein